MTKLEAAYITIKKMQTKIDRMEWLVINGYTLNCEHEEWEIADEKPRKSGD